MIRSGLAIFHDSLHEKATRGLFLRGAVDAIEWAIDESIVPSSPWSRITRKMYGMSGNLLGHGVHYSLLSRAKEDHYERWLRLFEIENKKYNYRHHSVHFGFSADDTFMQGTPLPFIPDPELTAHAVMRLKILQDMTGKPVGIENLAVAFSRMDVETQGSFIEDILAPIDGFLLLDLHNLYCLSRNFDIDIEALASQYPLSRVREIHISGGEWVEYGQGGIAQSHIRVDTHDDGVPEEVFCALPGMIRKCPNLEFVILERLPRYLEREGQQERLRSDFMRMKKLVGNANVQGCAA